MNEMIICIYLLILSLFRVSTLSNIYRCNINISEIDREYKDKINDYEAFKKDFDLFPLEKYKRKLIKSANTARIPIILLSLLVLLDQILIVVFEIIE